MTKPGDNRLAPAFAAIFQTFSTGLSTPDVEKPRRAFAPAPRRRPQMIFSVPRGA